MSTRLEPGGPSVLRPVAPRMPRNRFRMAENAGPTGEKSERNAHIEDMSGSQLHESNLQSSGLAQTSLNSGSVLELGRAQDRQC